MKMKRKIIILFLAVAVAGAGFTVPAAAGDQIKIEAEDYTYSSSPLTIANNTEVSNAKYVRIYEYPSPAGYTIGYEFTVPKSGTYEIIAAGSVLDRVYTSDWSVYLNEPSNASMGSKLLEDINVPSVKDVFKKYSFGLFRMKKGTNTLYVTVNSGDLQSQDMVVAFFDYFIIAPANDGVFGISSVGFRNSDSGTFTTKDNILLDIGFSGAAPADQKFNLKIEDAWRRTVLDTEFVVGKGMETLPLNLGKFAAGWYRVTTYEIGSDTPQNGYVAFAVTQPPSVRGAFADTAFASDLAAEYDTGTMKRAASYAQAMKLAGFDWVRSRGTGKAVTADQLNMKQKVHSQGIKTVEVMGSAVGYVNDASDMQFRNDLYSTSYQFWKDYPSYQKGYIDMVEVFNELDIASDSPGADLYAAYLKAAAIGLADSKYRPYVSATGLAMYSGLYFDLLMQNGALNYSDVYNFHAHAELEKRVGSARTYSNAYSKGDPVPLYLTEAGIHQIPEDGDTLSYEQMQVSARYGVTSAVTSLISGTDKHFWFLGRPYIENSGNYSAFHAWSYYPYPVYSALANMTCQLGEGIYKGEMANLPTGVCGALFDDGRGNDVAVYWAEEPSYIDISADRVRYSDLYGYEEEKNAVNGRVRVSVSQDPIYIRYSGRCELEAYYPVSHKKNVIQKKELDVNDRIVLQPLWQDVDPADKAAKNLGYSLSTDRDYQIDVNVYNLNGQAVSGTLDAKLSQGQHFGVIVEPAEFQLEPWGKTTVRVRLKATGEARPGQEGEIKIFGSLQDGAELSSAVSAYTFSMKNAVIGKDQLDEFQNYTNPKQWDLTNIQENGTLSFSSNPDENSITMQAAFTGSAYWYFPKLRVEDNSFMAGASGITFKRKCSADSEDLTSVFIYMKDGREYWSGTASAAAFTDEWETLTFPWSTFSLYKSPLGNVDIREFSTDQIEYVGVGVSGGTKNKPATIMKEFGVYRGFDIGEEINAGKIELTGIEDGAVYQQGTSLTLAARLPDADLKTVKVLSGNSKYEAWSRDGAQVAVDLSGLKRGKYEFSVCAENEMNYFYVSKITFYVE